MSEEQRGRRLARLSHFLRHVKVGLISRTYRTLAHFIFLFLERGRLAARPRILGHEFPKSNLAFNDPESPVWFHVASAGEWESLWSVAYAWLSSGGRLVLTHFSPSAVSVVQRFVQKMRAEGFEKQILYAGFSPREGDWFSALDRVRPQTFVSVKYEAWPDLWMCLAELEIPLALIGARPRRSLFLADRLACLGASRALKLTLFAFEPTSEAALRTRLWSAEVQVESLRDPRVDRLWNRTSATSDRVMKRVEEWRSRYSRPWGVVGSAWGRDLEVFESMGAEVPAGSIFVFPHDLAPQSLAAIQASLDRLKKHAVGDQAGRTTYVLVPEMGFLAEFYAFADWAFVGGGYGEGLHSVTEPAVQGLPILGGPQIRAQASEVSTLAELGQWTACPESDARACMKRWRDSGALQHTRREQWRAHWNLQRGGTEKLLAWLKWPTKRASARLKS